MWSQGLSVTTKDLALQGDKHSENWSSKTLQKLVASSLQLTHLGERTLCRVCVRACRLSPVGLFASLWTVTYQAPLSVGLSRQEYWRGVPFSTTRDLPNPGIELCLWCVLHGQVPSLQLEPLGNPTHGLRWQYISQQPGQPLLRPYKWGMAMGIIEKSQIDTINPLFPGHINPMNGLMVRLRLRPVS